MATGLSAEQIAMLKKMPGIDQNLVSAYEKQGQNLTDVEKTAISKADTSAARTAEIASQSFVTPEVKASVQKSFPTQTVTQTPAAPAAQQNTPKVNIPTKDRVNGMQAFSSALQQAVNLGRAQRQSAELDFLGGVIPVGGVSASQFTGLLANLNKASNQFTEPLVDRALGFAQDEQQAIADEQNQIRDLALAAVEAGGSQETVNAILAAGSVDSAISVAAGTLNTGSKMVVEKVGSNLVQYDPADPDNTTKVLFSADGASSGGSTPSGGASTRSATVDTKDWLNMSTNELLIETKKVFSNDVANKIATELTNEQLKLFMNDYMTGSASGEIVDLPMNYYKQWRVAAGLDEAEQTAEDSGIVNRFR